jgi:hypothetical protein
VPSIGERMETTADPTQLLLPNEVKSNIWQSAAVADRLASLTAAVWVDGKESKGNLCVMEHCVPWVEQLHMHFPPNSGSASTTRPLQAMMKKLTERVKLLCQNSYEGKIGLISGKPMVDSSLKVIANSDLGADFTSFGRHATGHRLLQVRYYYEDCADPAIKAQLNKEVGKLAKQENHVNEKVIDSNYAAYKEPKYASFTSLQGRTFRSKLTDRWSSHPDVYPAANAFPWTAVATLPADGSMHERCHDMRLLAPVEQNAQLVWMQELELAWKKRRDYSAWCSTAAWQAKCHKMDAELKEAQAKWKVKFPKQWEARRTWTQALADKAAALLSPRKRARTATDAESSKRVKRGGTPE